MKRGAKALLGLFAAYLIVLAAAHVWAHADPTHRPCPPRETLLLVDADARVLCLCRDGRADATFRVALGRGGIDKRAEGDGRTPLGSYGLQASRPSTRYHVFIPVAYPTAEQQRSGYTGGDVGVHGPHIAFASLRHATLWVDWTRGCIAVGTGAEADRIAAWVRARGAARISIL